MPRRSTENRDLLNAAIQSLPAALAKEYWAKLMQFEDELLKEILTKIKE